MVKTLLRLFFSLILLAALPAAGFSQDAKTVINNVTKALGAENMSTLHFSGSGSTYVPGADPKAAWTHQVMKSYVRDLNFSTASSQLQIVNVIEGKDQPAARNTQTGSPWPEQVDYWMTPYSFLKGAAAHPATVETKKLTGTEYKAVTFTPQDKHSVVGYITDKDLVYKLESRVMHPTLGDTVIETFFHDYADFGGLKFPTTIIQKIGGHLSTVLIVKEVKKS
jgi:hypothetical protein